MTGHRQDVLKIFLLVGFTVGLFGSADAAPIGFVLREDYLLAAGAQTEIDFDEFGVLTTITNQYAGLGVTFTDGNDVTVVGVGNSLTDDDNVGLAGTLAVGPDMGITFILSDPRASVGLTFGDVYGFLFGGNAVTFFSGGTAVYGISGQSAFMGIVSADLLIDRVVISPILGGTEGPVIVDLLVGEAQTDPTAVPEPASIALLGAGLACLAARRRR